MTPLLIFLLAALHLYIPVAGLLLVALQQERASHRRMLQSAVREVAVRRAITSRPHIRR